MRLLGLSAAGRIEARGQDLDFDALIVEAVKLLHGESVPAGLEPDEVRDRLLAGFQFILVDEYQDIDAPQYEMISALAGRTQEDPELKLSILAVGDDDEDIYAFRGTNVEFIRRFQQDYQAEVHYLVENYRSTRYIIEAANQLIAVNTDRMKTGHPIRIDRHRELLPPGGEFGKQDLFSQGKVQVIQVPDESGQAQAVLAEIRRLRQLGVATWSELAVLSSRHRDLAAVRALAEQARIPVRWYADHAKMPPLHQVREIRQFLLRMSESRNSLARASDLIRQASEEAESNTRNPWCLLLVRLLEAWRSESHDAELPHLSALEFLYEACAESRRDFSFGEGVALSTVHSAKGTESNHVLLIGAWPLHPDRARQEEQRRAFYVGMSRARKTLAIFDRLDCRPSLSSDLAPAAIVPRELPRESRTLRAATLSYTLLGLDDIHLGYPGQFGAQHPIHAALAALQPMDKLTLRALDGGGLGLENADGVCVGRLSHKADSVWRRQLHAIRETRVVALVCRTDKQDPEETRRNRYQVSEWHVPVVEVVSQDGRGECVSV